MRSIKSTHLAAVALAVAGLAAAPASIAASATGVLAVSATVLSTCVVIATPMLFGSYSLGQVDPTATITVTCTPDVTDYKVALDAGLGGGTTSTRKMTNGAATLSYNLYRDLAHTQNWGNSAGVDTAPFSAGSGTLVKTFTVYGHMPANQASAIGAYIDTVQVSVNY